jgi:hypothetical protein
VYASACREAAGTNLGNIREQPPTGKRVEFAGISLLTFNEAGQIETTMVFRCVHSIGRALGRLHPAAGAEAGWLHRYTCNSTLMPSMAHHGTAVFWCS